MTEATKEDVMRAKRAILWDDDMEDEYTKLFTDGDDPDGFVGDRRDRRVIRQSMKKYERQEATIGEDKLMYDSRLNLQHMDVMDKRGEVEDV
jgi:hypothetical protein